MLWVLSIYLKLYYRAHVFSKLNFMVLTLPSFLSGFTYHRHNAIVMLPFMV